MEKQIRELLKKCGVPAHLLGYEYLVEAIKLCKEDWENLHFITRGVYPRVADKFNCTSQNVERCIRHAVDVALLNMPQELISELFGHTVSADHPTATNSLFIATLMDLVEV